MSWYESCRWVKVVKWWRKKWNKSATMLKHIFSVFFQSWTILIFFPFRLFSSSKPAWRFFVFVWCLMNHSVVEHCIPWDDHTSWVEWSFNHPLSIYNSLKMLSAIKFVVFVWKANIWSQCQSCQRKLVPSWQYIFMFWEFQRHILAPMAQK